MFYVRSELQQLQRGIYYYYSLLECTRRHIQNTVTCYHHDIFKQAIRLCLSDLKVVSNAELKCSLGRSACGKVNGAEFF
jgi:hypothetical protein